MTTEEITRARELIEAASYVLRFEWEIQLGDEDDDLPAIVTSDGDKAWIAECNRVPLAEFFIACRTLVPRLLDYVAELEQERDHALEAAISLGMQR